MFVKEVKPFKLLKQEEKYQSRILKIIESTVEPGETENSVNIAPQRTMVHFTCSHWVNVVPITSDGKVVFVEQYRVGNQKITLETPGGAVDSHEKDVTMSAIRELEEETGFTSSRLLSLASFAPNPAIQNNLVYFFIAFDAVPSAKPAVVDDPFEQIKLHLIDFDEAVRMARTGQIKHSLCALALLLAEPFYKSRKSARE
jgi:ADP-ribose pyrophosphatase